ncbi:recombinase family protein [Flavobacteriaceae bacterium S0825]|uniref:recombinase family protein n=1 Tax=Gaetbulibacter sp. S0825 TaxID=2720084 RepID=UPI00143224A4|nr:recombinase family protein [Gaetbulibacter sp. S0825]MCK0109536.1 recombinase family protein [Flavobacteriaceae bacterium S0825]NIX65169.1 recombinase family protein [Gaetbulibacter sp. S0825]
MGIKKAKYIRVSSLEQNSSRQRETDEKVKLYEDKVSGLIPFSERPSGKRLIKDIQEGKINYVIIHSVDRLGRNVVEMQKQLNWFIENGVQIYAENIRMELLNDNGSMNSIAKMIIDLLGSVAGLEIEAIKERQKQGIEIAKAKGVYKGRKVGATMSNTKYLERHKDVVELLKDGLSLNKVSKYTKKAFVTVKKVQTRLEKVA